MAVGDTDVNICSTALNLLGESEISSFSDGSEIAGVCDKLYPGTKNTMLAMYPWSFATKKVQLAQLSSTPINEWQYEYQLPSDLIMSGPQAVYKQADAPQPARRVTSAAQPDAHSLLSQQISPNVTTPSGNQLQTLAAQMGTAGDFGAIRGELSRQALSDLTLGGQLSDRQLRDAVEQARQWATATGRQFDQAAVIRELQARQQASGQEEARRRAFAGQVLSGEAGLQGRELGAAESDVERELRRRFMEQQAEQHALTQERAYAGQLLGAEQATSADPFQAILGRPSGAGPALGQQQFAGGMALGAQAGPQYLNPEAGLGFIQNQAANQASMYGAQVGADAAATAAKYGMVGDIASSIIGLKKP